MEALRRQAVSRCRLCGPSSIEQSSTWLVRSASIVPTSEIARTLATGPEGTSARAWNAPVSCQAGHDLPVRVTKRPPAPSLLTHRPWFRETVTADGHPASFSGWQPFGTTPTLRMLPSDHGTGSDGAGLPCRTSRHRALLVARPGMKSVALTERPTFASCRRGRVSRS